MKILDKTNLGSRTLLFALLSFASAHAISGPPRPVPFKADVTTLEIIGLASDIEPSCLPFSLPIAGMTVGVGNASHLGKIAFVATDCVIINGSNFAFTNGQATVTAANGDKLFITYSGTFGPLQFSASEWPTANIVPANSRFEVNKGTGRFINASGGGTLSGQLKVNPKVLGPIPDLNAEPSPGLLHLEGTIKY